VRHSIRELQQTSWRSDRKRRLRDRRPIVESLEGRALLSTTHHPGADGHALAAQAKKAPTGYQQINLVSDLSSEGDQITDSNLKNPWGMAYSAMGPFWISDAGAGVSTIYNVTPSNAVTKAKLTVTVPGASAGSSGSPTGQVVNTTSSFQLNGKAAVFIFDALQGTIAAWSSGTAAQTVVNDSSTAEYTGLAIGSSGGQNYTNDDRESPR
jgi:hypothetical protein